MLPILFIIPKFSSAILIKLLGFEVIFFTLLFFLFRKKANSVINLKNDLLNYLFFFLIITTLLYFFGPFPIRTYGVAVAFGFVSAILIARFLCKKNNLDPDIIVNLSIYILIGVLLGARIFFVIFYDWNYFITNPLKFFAFWEGGLVFYGGLVGGIVSGYYYLKKHKLNIMAYSDIIGVCTFIGIFFGRLGCLSYGCCFGKVAEGFPLAIKFPAIGNKLTGMTPAFENHLHQGFVTTADCFSLPVYPTQIISSLDGLILFIIFLFLYKKRKFTGQITGLTLIFYAIARSLEELLRIEPKFLYLSISQWISIFIFALGIYIYKISQKQASL